MERDFSNFPPYMDYSIGGVPPQGDMNDLYRDPMFNPMAQYEQAYCYYRYLCMQMDYKIKCKEYEKMCGSKSTTGSNSNTTSNSERLNNRRIE